VIDEAAQAVEPSVLVPLVMGCKQVCLGWGGDDRHTVDGKMGHGGPEGALWAWGGRDAASLRACRCAMGGSCAQNLAHTVAGFAIGPCLSLIACMLPTP
jgi:hypothetical protein